MKEKRRVHPKKLILIVIIVVSIVFGIMFTPHFLFRRTSIHNSINEVLDAGVSLGLSENDYTVVDFRGRWTSMYIKLELTLEAYNHAKQQMLLSSWTASSRDFTEYIQSEESRYRYSSRDFDFTLSLMRRRETTRKINSMNLNDFEEMLIIEMTDAKAVLFGGTTGFRSYVLVHEMNGNYCLYFVRG